jgi:hypothetical protein
VQTRGMSPPSCFPRTPCLQRAGWTSLLGPLSLQEKQGGGEWTDPLSF